MNIDDFREILAARDDSYWEQLATSVVLRRSQLRLLQRYATFIAGTISAISVCGANNCTDETTSGWCYVRGSCLADAGRACDQAICASAGFLGEHLGYSVAWILCP